MTGNSVVDNILQVLETCVKNCGVRFHIYIAQKEFLQELVKLAMPRNNPPHFVLDKVLGLIQVHFSYMLHNVQDRETGHFSRIILLQPFKIQ